MKLPLYLLLLLCAGLFSCRKVIDLYPQSNVYTDIYYSNLTEVKAGVTGCYNGMQAPMVTEWMLTELRSDNAKQGVTNSSSSSNRELNDLDMFTVNSTHPQVYNYWLATYNNIRNCNFVLQKLGVAYDPTTGATTFKNIDIPLTDVDRKQLAGEALFIRAHHYFNLVRLFGGVFLVTDPISPEDAKKLNRAGVDDIYKLIQADLVTAAASMTAAKYSATSADLGRATSWAAKGLLGKVYLTLNKKSEAITVLNDVKNNGGFALQSSYANIFSTGNEMNSEILFAIRYKAGGLGIGSPFANTFSPVGSGAAVVNGDGQGLDYPTADLDSTVKTADGRKATVVARYTSGATTKLYTKKFLSTVTTANDAENDWPVLRYADIVLMLAEAQGLSQSSIDLINLIRTRAGVPVINSAGITTTKLFEDTLSNERRIELSFENQRWFDLLRFNKTMTTITAENTIKAHFAKEYPVHYKDYPAPALTLTELQGYVTPDRLLLPIPQREIDTNTQLKITQNPGY